MVAAYTGVRDSLSEELAHDLFQLVFAYQLMSDGGSPGLRLDDDVERDRLLACALRSYASLLRETHRDREAAMVLMQAQALNTPAFAQTPVALIG
jgi:hypothetical protein